MTFGKTLAFYGPWICFVIFMIFTAWHFFIKKILSKILFNFGYMRYSSYHDELRGMNEHVRLLRRNFYRAQKKSRKYFFRVLKNSCGEADISVINGRNFYNMQCLETGEIRQKDEDWLLEALHFKIISNAEARNGKIELTEDAYTDEVPEYNKKVGDISYFNEIIGAYSDWSLVKMDVDAISSKFYE